MKEVEGTNEVVRAEGEKKVKGETKEVEQPVKHDGEHC